MFINPPYGRMTGQFVEKAYEEHLRDPDRFIVLLIPSRTDTNYKNGQHVDEYESLDQYEYGDMILMDFVAYFNDYLAPCTVIELMEVKDE